MMIKVILFFVLLIDVYYSVIILWDKHVLQKWGSAFNHKNHQYYESLLKKHEKQNKIKTKEHKNLFYIIALKMHQAGLKNGPLINPISIFIISLFLFGTAYCLFVSFLKEILLSFLLSIPVFFVPLFVLHLYTEYQQRVIENASLDFLLQLKNYVQINNDIMYAFKEVKTMKPLQTEINVFLFEMNSGVKFERAIKNLQDRILNKMLKDFFANIEYCYLYGGSFSVLISKSYRMISEIHQEKEKRVAETKSARMVLYFLMALNLLVYVISIRNNHENYIIMKKTLLGNVILYWNFLSAWLLFFLAEKVKKLDV